MDKVKPHTQQKHKFLEHYLNIWSDHVGKEGKVNVPTLDIFDLFSSYGMCHCKENDEEWEGSAVLSARCLSKYPKGRILWLNSYNPDPDVMLKQREGLEGWLSNLDIPSRVKIEIVGLPVDQAVESALNVLKPNFPSLWILDPHQGDHLPWGVVEKIASSEGQFTNRYGKVIKRKPELFITLMTGRLQAWSGHSDGQEDRVSIALGMAKEEWKQLIDKLKSEGLNTGEAIVEIYRKKIENVYGVNPICYTVPGVHGNLVYTIFLVTDKDAGRFMMLVKKYPEYSDWLEEEYKPKEKKLKKRRKAVGKKEKTGHASLDDYVRKK